MFTLQSKHIEPQEQKKRAPVDPTPKFKYIDPSISRDDDCLYIKRTPTDTGIKYDAFISGTVVDTNRYVELIHILLNASTSDEIIIHLNSYGGSVETGYTIINAMESSRANITTIALGNVASVAAMIWSFGDKLIVSRWSILGFHMSSHGDNGKSMSIAERATDIVKFVRYMTDFVKTRGLLTEEDLTNIVDNKADVFIFGDDMIKRLANIQPNPLRKRAIHTDGPNPTELVTQIKPVTKGVKDEAQLTQSPT